jgi:hypothetical protein
MPDDMKHFYTAHQYSILQRTPTPLTQYPPNNEATFCFSSYYDCAQHFLAWGPQLLDFFNNLVGESVEDVLPQ